MTVNVKKQEVVVVGAGRIGKAIGRCVSVNAVVQWWDANPALVRNKRPLAQSVPTASAVFLCVPVSALRTALQSVAPYLSKGAVIVSLTKGLEQGTGKTVERILKEELPKGQSLVVLGGPLLAEELVKKGGVAVAGTESSIAVPRIRDLFAQTFVVVETSKDVRGVALCGALKNMYALGFGVVHGLGWGENRKGAYAGRAAEEMYRLLRVLRADPQTFFTPAGLADFLATGLSKDSAHRAIGVAHVQKKKCEGNRDGCASIVPLLFLLGKKAASFPLLCALHRVFVQNADARAELSSVLFAKPRV